MEVINTVTGAQAKVAKCSPGGKQSFMFAKNGKIVKNSHLCVGATENTGKIELVHCSDPAAATKTEWNYDVQNHRIKLIATDKCLGIDGEQMIQLQSCNGSSVQMWTFRNNNDSVSLL